MSNGRIWPYAIAISILAVFGFCVATVVVTQKNPVQKSDMFMMSYQEADAKANELIGAKIAFDGKYKIEFLTQTLTTKSTVIAYKITDTNMSFVNDAKIKVIITRPNDHAYDQELVNPSTKDGVYTFNAITLPKEGRWDIMAKIEVGEFSRFYNVKTDTRNSEFIEY